MKITEFKEFAIGTVKSFQTDLDHDVNFMETGVPCLIFLREMGSHIVTLNPFEEYPKSFEKVKYLFGYADRHHILNDKKAMFQHCLKASETKVILSFNGKNLKVIKPERATNIMEQYFNSIRGQFNKFKEI